MTAGAPATSCTCCGNEKLQLRRVLWPELIAQWELSPSEVAYIDRQQGLMCGRCGSNLRTMALAHALLTYYEHTGTFSDFVSSPVAASLAVLEINEAGMLTQFLRRLPHHTLIRYPDSDMTKLAFADKRFDVVVHSDTLEHVPDPVAGLRECRRVLERGGICILHSRLFLHNPQCSIFHPRDREIGELWVVRSLSGLVEFRLDVRIGDG